MWYPMAAVLMTWTPPEPWEAVDGSSVSIKKALHYLKTQLPEKAQAMAGGLGWVPLKALKQNMDEALTEAMQIFSRRKMPWVQGCNN